MTPEEIQALARRIADILAEQGLIPGPGPTKAPPRTTPPGYLGDVAPVPGQRTASGRHRPAYDALTAATRAAAAGRGPSPLPGGHSRPGGGAAGRTVPVAISNRHIHITQADFERLFGSGKHLSPEKSISQPGQFAAAERVRVRGPRGVIEGIRIVGPTRQITQVELSSADCRTIGLAAPVRHSGSIAGSAAVILEGPAGSVSLPEGAIIAARHIHVSPADATRLGVSDGDRVTVVVGPADRQVTLPDVAIRSGPSHATEMHLDVDEAHAFGVVPGDLAILTGRPRRGRLSRPERAGRLPLLTEREVDAVAARGETLSSAAPYRMTPLARDRARALGIWREKP